MGLDTLTKAAFPIVLSVSLSSWVAFRFWRMRQEESSKRAADSQEWEKHKDAFEAVVHHAQRGPEIFDFSATNTLLAAKPVFVHQALRTTVDGFLVAVENLALAAALQDVAQTPQRWEEAVSVVEGHLRELKEAAATFANTSGA